MLLTPLLRAGPDSSHPSFSLPGFHSQTYQPLPACGCHAEVPKSQSHIVRGLRAHSNRKIGNLAADALVAAGQDERFDVSSERLDGVMLMVGD